jgi:arylsulfatase A-like enzyme
MMNKIILIICSLLVFSCVSTTNTNVQKNDAKMNILFIAVDDLNHWVNYLGRNKQTKTPNLDRLSAMGMSFTNAHCAAPVCCPSRAAVLSGLRPSTTGVYGNQDDWRLAIPKEITMPTFFRNNGYNVMAGGKIYHGGNYDREDEFDYYYHSPRNDFNKKIIKKGIEGGGMNWGEIDDGDEALSDYHLASWASEELLKKHEKPQFLAVGFTKPHLPWNVPKKYFDMFPVESIELPPYQEDDMNDIPQEGINMANPEFDHTKIKNKTEWKQAIRAYLASIAYVDAQIGRVLDAYERSPEKDHTIILLWGDHGWHLGEKHHWRKATLWEESTRSPLIWVVPNMTKAGSRCDKTIDFMSFYPTLSELAGLKKPSHLEGVSIVSLLKNSNAEWNVPALTTFQENNHSIRSSKYRYTKYAQGGEEFYDEAKDPYEWKNLYADPNIQSEKVKLSRFLPKINKKAVGNNGIKAGD